MRIELPSGTPAELARPGGEPSSRPEGGPSFGLVVAPDIFGLRPLFDDLCARLASEHGYTVCAPDPFPGRNLPTIDDRFAAVPQLYDEDVLRDLSQASDATGCARVGLIGFCMGGMYALKAAGTGRYHRVAAFYGMIRLPAAWRGPGHKEPLDLLQSPLRAPVLAIIGEADPYTPAPDVAELEKLGVAVVRYPGAEHGFVHDPSRPSHRAADAADAWARVHAFLQS